MYKDINLKAIYDSVEELTESELYDGEQLMYRVLFKTHPSDVSGTYSLARAFQRGLYGRNFDTFKNTFKIAMQEAKNYKFNVATPDFSHGIHKFMEVVKHVHNVHSKEYSSIIDDVCLMYTKHLDDIEKMDKEYERGITITSKSTPIQDHHLKNEIVELLESGQVVINGGL